MTNLNIEWVRKNDNFVGDIKIGKTVVIVSPTFKKHVGDKTGLVFSGAGQDGLVLGFVDSAEGLKGIKISKLSTSDNDMMSASLSDSLRHRFIKGHYNLRFLGGQDGISAYELTLINTSNGQAKK